MKLFMSSARWKLVRAAGAIVLLVACIAARDPIGGILDHRYANLLQIGFVIVAAVLGTIAVHDGLGLVLRGLDQQAGVVLRNLGSWSLYGLLALWSMSELGVNLSGLLVGGAILGVIVASASQASLGNFFSGLVLMMARPYRVGATIRLRSSVVGTVEYEGTVQDMHALYTTLRTAKGEVLHMPNSTIATSALVVGRSPLQAELDADVPARTSLTALRQAVQDELGERLAVVSVTPVKLVSSDEPTMTCRVEVRSARTVDPAAVAEAIARAVDVVRPEAANTQRAAAAS
ncbi:MAG: mechanosensitive ion channel [Candidatus Dormibacteraeota bacterium]|nr:mechanosensitive ion channel [Candidatus Dormibacteraeota bacterium]MBO0761899.1 mechanosensitive ion channel [Candidatus Dormibacteraeota bacterium]